MSPLSIFSKELKKISGTSLIFLHPKSPPSNAFPLSEYIRANDAKFSPDKNFSLTILILFFAEFFSLIDGVSLTETSTSDILYSLFSLNTCDWCSINSSISFSLIFILCEITLL